MGFWANQAYSGQAFRYYFKDPRPDPDSDVARLNLAAAETAMQKMSVRDRGLLREAYTSKVFPLSKAVAQVAQETGTAEREIWNAIRIATRHFARARGL